MFFSHFVTVSVVFAVLLLLILVPFDHVVRTHIILTKMHFAMYAAHTNGV